MDNFLTLGPPAGPAIRFWLYRQLSINSDLHEGVLSVTVAFSSGPQADAPPIPRLNACRALAWCGFRTALCNASCIGDRLPCGWWVSLARRRTGDRLAAGAGACRHWLGGLAAGLRRVRRVVFWAAGGSESIGGPRADLPSDRSSAREPRAWWFGSSDASWIASSASCQQSLAAAVLVAYRPVHMRCRGGGIVPRCSA